MSLALFNWAHLYQGLRRGVPGELYRSAAAVERIEARPDGTTLHLRPGGSLDFDLVVCADGYRSMGRRLIDPDATPRYRGMVVWRGLLPESELRVDPLDGCDGVRPMYQGGHGLMYYVPRSGQSTEPGQRLLTWGYYLQVPESTLASVLVDDQERQQSSSVPFGKVHPQVRAGFESRLAGLLPRCCSSWCSRAATARSMPCTPLCPAAMPAIAFAWSATPVRCSPRSRAAAS